jgi:Tfp pilus assembly protein PilV
VRNRDEGGFTLLELLIVCVVSPLVVGALALGLMTVLSLQSGVSNRLADSADSQVVQASFRNDVQSAQYLTTQSTNSPQCGTGLQVLGLEWNENPTTNVYETVVSYMSVPVTTGSTTTYSLVRQECTNVTSTQSPIQPVTSTTILSTNLAANLIASESTPIILPGSSQAAAKAGWVATNLVTSVSFPIAEPGTTASTSSKAYDYTLVASPPAANLPTEPYVPLTSSANVGCGYASKGSGTYASALCLVDFSALSANNGALMVAARQGCVELSVPLPGGSTLYFCMSITGAPVEPSALPTWTDGFLGNQINGVPFYSDVPGNAALYQSCEGDSSTCSVTDNGSGPQVTNTWGGVTTIQITDITVVAPDGNPATGWEFVSADAESTDSGESIQWTSNEPMYDIPNNEPSEDTASDPIGNACNSGAGVSGSYTDTTGTTQLTSTQIFGGSPATSITCSGNSNGTKTGTLMVQSLQPTTMTITMVGTGLEGISLGLLF